MPQSHRPLLLILLLALAFAASAQHPYGHELNADEQLEPQICLHHTASPLAVPRTRHLPQPNPPIAISAA